MNLENDVVSTVHSAIAEAIKNKLSGYNTPLDAYIKNALDRNQKKIQDLFDDAVMDCLTDEFGSELRNCCSKKLAKVIISKMEGEIEKRANELRANPEFRAKLTLAITETLKSIQP